MEQRRLRLGDILDDYCPRERRVTNHVIVAMIEEDIKQTRCTTCDAEHAYKGARVPKRRKKDAPAALFKEVLAGLSAPDEPPLMATSGSAGIEDGYPDEEPAASNETRQEPMKPPSLRHHDEHDGSRNGSEPPEQELGADPAPQVENTEGDRPDTAGEGEPAVDGPVHRRLIRATLPRPEGQKDARPLPEFTVRQVPARGNGGGNFRVDRMRMRGGNGHGGHGEANGNRAGRFGGNRGGSGRPPSGRGPSGFRGGSGKGKRGRGPRG